MGNCCCFCCTNEAYRVGKVMDRFPAKLPSTLGPLPEGSPAKIVGRCAPAPMVGNTLFSPITNQPCVFYKCRVEEKHVRYERREGQPDRRVEEWRQVCTEQRSVDFVLVDDSNATAIVQLSSGQLRISGHTSGSDRSNGGFFGIGQQNLAPGVQAMMERNGHSTTSWFGTNRTLRAHEIVFALGEAVAVMGIITRSGGQLVIKPVFSNSVSPEQMEREEWSSREKQSWGALTKRGPTVLISDEGKHIESLIGSRVAQITMVPGITAMGGAPMPGANPYGASARTPLLPQPGYGAISQQPQGYPPQQAYPPQQPYPPQQAYPPAAGQQAYPPPAAGQQPYPPQPQAPQGPYPPAH